MQTSLGKYPQVVNGFENWEQIDKYKKTKKYKKQRKRSNKNPNELWDYNIPQSIDDVWSDFELRIKKEKWDEIFYWKGKWE